MDIPAGDASAYRFAQLDDYSGLPRGQFPSYPSLTLSLPRVCLRQFHRWDVGLWLVE